MLHVHHIIPKHAGGNDEPSNLITLTVEEHAHAHKLLYEKYGRKEDEIAWKALSGQASKKEIVAMGLRLGREKTNKILEQRYGNNWKTIISKKGAEKSKEVLHARMKSDKIFADDVKKRAKHASNMALKEESRLKRIKTLSDIKHQQGVKNSNYGNMWIYNEQLKISKLIKKNSTIPEGWLKGRKIFPR